MASLSDHKDWVQGVAWDPLNKYIATQGKDRWVEELICTACVLTAAT